MLRSLLELLLQFTLMKIYWYKNLNLNLRQIIQLLAKKISAKIVVSNNGLFRLTHFNGMYTGFGVISGQKN